MGSTSDGGVCGSGSPLARISEKGSRVGEMRPVVEVLLTLLDDACPGWTGVA